MQKFCTQPHGKVVRSPLRGMGKKKMGGKKKFCGILQKCFNIIARSHKTFGRSCKKNFLFRSMYVRVRETKNKTKNTKMERAHPLERFIEFYFVIGLKYKEIKSVHGSRHSFLISERHLKRLLNRLFCHKAYTDLAVLVEFISNQLQYPGQLYGYRWMYAKCNVMIVGSIT